MLGFIRNCTVYSIYHENGNKIKVFPKFSEGSQQITGLHKTGSEQTFMYNIIANQVVISKCQ